jgi:two-component system, response regulator YesN
MAERAYTVFIAEDEELLLYNLVDKINTAELGFKVTGTAQTGERAWKKIEQEQPDLLITDLQMPVMNGIELMQKVHHQYPAVKLVIISGYSLFSYAQEAVHLQVVEYLLKPIDNKSLFDVLVKAKVQLDSEFRASEELFIPSNAMTPELIVEAVKEYILENYTKNINLNMIADNLHYTGGYLTKIFYQHCGCTPSKYLITLRINKAKGLLAHCPCLSVKQISCAAGYEDQAYFSRIFKKYTGKSPADYRSSYDEEPAVVTDSAEPE